MINVFPQPNCFTEKNGNFIFKDKVYFHVAKDLSNHDFIDVSKVLWNNFTAGKSELDFVFCDKASGCAKISLKSQDALVCKETDYEYELECNESGIDICYSREIGLIHAFLTILQLISPFRRKTKDFSVGCISISDKPALRMRAVHLCVFPETDILFLTKLVRLCGLLKCSHIVLEFWGMLKFSCFKYMSWDFAWSKSDLAEIFRFGKGMGIEFIPMFNHMGHATQSRFKAGKNVVLDQAPEYEELFVPGGWTWDIKNAETLELLKNIREELCEIFPDGEYFHIGCDETYALDNRWDGYDIEDNKTFTEYVNAVSEHLKSLGRKPIMWADMFIDKEKFPHPYVSNSSSRCYRYEENLEQIDDDMIFADWQYYIDENHSGTVEFFTEKRNPDNVVICPWDDTTKIRGMARLAKKFGLLGMMGTTWNTVYHEIRHMVYSACVMWDEDDSATDICTWETLKSFAAQNIRKLVVPGGVYEKAGFMKTELFHAVD